MKLIRTEDAVGHVLCHDLTQIIKDQYKDARFRKGHVVQPEDIPVLLSVGKDNIYVWENDGSPYHEDEAAEILRDMCMNDGMRASKPKEGKIEISAARGGLFLVDRERLRAVNSFGRMMMATRPGGVAVKAGDKLCGTRVIPLVIEEEKLQAAEAAAGDVPIMAVLPYKVKTAGIVTTGSEVFKGLIKDTFTPVVEEKLRAFGIAVTEHEIVGDGLENVAAAIARIREKGVDMILCTGGTSVDPDDNTPGAIKRSGARIVTYGAPVLPGAMFLLGYFDDGTPIMGLPGCVMYAGATIFDLVLPWVAADVTVTKEWIVSLGEGGLCLGCQPCHWPACPFGK